MAGPSTPRPGWCCATAARVGWPRCCACSAQSAAERDSLVGSLVSHLRALPRDGCVLHVQDPSRVRDQLDVDQATAMLVALAQRGANLPPLMILCSGHPVTVGAWAEALAPARGAPMRLARWDTPVRAHDPPRVVGDPATLRRLGHAPQPIVLDRLAARIIIPWPG